jgi:hypothetical protein
MQDFDATQYGEADRREVDPPLKGRSPVGQPEARSIGGLRNAGSGSDAYGARTVASDGSKLLIFVRSAGTVVGYWFGERGRSATGD